jgi:pimeloyl-ACP methyl ester carboxylesterase
MKRNQLRLLLCAALALSTGCAPLAKVTEKKPELGTTQAGKVELSPAEQAIDAASKLRRTDPTRALGTYLAAAEAASTQLRRNADGTSALRDYNFALSRAFEVILNANLDPWTHPLQVPVAGGGDYLLTHRPHRNRLWKPEEFDLIPVDQLNVRGKFVLPRKTRDGAGAALIAVRRGAEMAEARQRFIAARVYFGVTALAHFDGHHCEIEFLDPLATETANVAGRTLALGADFTAPVALALARERPEKIGLSRVIFPEKYAATARLSRLQPYDPDKIPVIFIHGLQSTPATWAPMINALRGDPILRRKYQLWVYSYPSGYPLPYTAVLLRRELNALDKVFPDHKKIVLIGHSMGGLVSRLMVSDSEGEKIWRTYFGKSPAQTALSPNNKALLTEALIFKPRPEIARVIFMSSPHRGSLTAQNPLGRIASSIIRIPAQFVTIGPEILQAAAYSAQDDPTVMRMKRMPNSIDTLSPNNRFVKILNTLPIAKGIPYHSVIGDRGRGDTPNSSDGVVAYWSSHLDGARSEKIVPSAHGSNATPEGIAEVERILKEHVGIQESRSVRKTTNTVSELSVPASLFLATQSADGALSPADQLALVNRR